MTPPIQQIIAIMHDAGNSILLPGYQKQSTASIKDDGSVITEADLRCQNFLQQQLSALAPELSFLGEEMSEQEQIKQLQSEIGFWCVDPLDGTSNFATPIPMFAISIALIIHGKPALACIYDPIRRETFSAIQGQGFRLNGQSIQNQAINQLSHAVGFVDFKRLDKQTATFLATQKVYRSQRNIGSCALEWAWLAAGRGQFIIHGREKLWDYAAGTLLAEEAGCIVSDFHGQHPFAQEQLSCPIAAAPRQIHSQLLGALQAARHA